MAVAAETVVAPDSSSLFELLLAPEMLSMADVAAVNGCSKNLWNEMKSRLECGTLRSTVRLKYMLGSRESVMMREEKSKL